MAMSQRCAAPPTSANEPRAWASGPTGQWRAMSAAVLGTCWVCRRRKGFRKASTPSRTHPGENKECCTDTPPAQIVGAGFAGFDRVAEVPLWHRWMSLTP